MIRFVEKQKAIRLMAVFALMLVAGISLAAGRYDGNWTTNLSCEAHGQTEAYKWEFPSTIKDNNFHGQHGEPGGPGYLLIEGKIAEDGTAKLSAKGTVLSSNQHARGVFALKGDNYGYNIKAKFGDTKGTGTRDEGAGILGRPCTFEFVKQDPSAPKDPNAQQQGSSPQQQDSSPASGH